MAAANDSMKALFGKFTETAVRKRCASKVVFALQVDSNIRIRQRNVTDRGVYAGKRLIYHTMLPTDKLYSRLSITRNFKGNRKKIELSGDRRK